jgi:hypothetical protein
MKRAALFLFALATPLLADDAAIHVSQTRELSFHAESRVKHTNFGGTDKAKYGRLVVCPIRVHCRFAVVVRLGQRRRR